MKQISIALNVVLISIIVFIGCSRQSHPSAPIILSHGTSDQCPACKSYAKDYEFEGISAIAAQKMSGKYKSENQLLFRNNTLDARSAWFSLETIKAFVYLIEKATCDSGCSDLNLGVRIYYAKYPTNNQDSLKLFDMAKLPESNYAEHHTIFMVPTYQDKNSPDINWDFDPWHIGGSPCEQPVTFDSLFRISPTILNQNNRSLILSPELRQLGMSAGKGGGFLPPTDFIKNHGGLIPPDPPQGTAF